MLIGGPGTDRLTVGAGDDTIVFRPGFGHDTVINVGDMLHHDTLDLRGLGFADVQSVFDSTDLGPNAVIHVTANDDITLPGAYPMRPLVDVRGDAHVVPGSSLAAVGDNSLKFCGCRMPNAEEPGASVDDMSGRPVRNVA